MTDFATSPKSKYQNTLDDIYQECRIRNSEIVTKRKDTKNCIGETFAAGKILNDQERLDKLWIYTEEKNKNKKKRDEFEETNDGRYCFIELNFIYLN